MPRGWTPDELARFEAAVNALGGPFAASPAPLLELMPAGVLTTAQLTYGLKRWRVRLCNMKADGDVEGAALSASRTRRWPADARARVDAVIAALGGLKWVTPRSIAARLPDIVFAHNALSNYLREERTGLPAESPSGIQMLGEKPAAGHPHGWSRSQCQLFLAAVRALGGIGEATKTSVYELLQRGPPEGAVTKKQARSGLESLQEALCKAGVSSSGGKATHTHDTRESEDAAAVKLWLEGGGRLRWAPDALQRLEAAIEELGGLQLAKPKALMALLRDDDFTQSQVANALCTLRWRQRNAAARSAAVLDASQVPLLTEDKHQ